ncbi:MAG: hypothetical protein JJU28_08600 [Cyclobacteriaceae bacterium]|nr:hypothetical protein [Cyclobacteriaceae bacterium]
MKNCLFISMPEKYRKVLRLIGGMFCIWLFIAGMELSLQYFPLANKIISHAKEEGLRVSALFYTDEPATAHSEEWCRQHFQED